MSARKPATPAPGPVEGTWHAAAQKLKWFLSDSTWDPTHLNTRRSALLLRQNPHTAPTRQGVLVIDETGDHKWDTKTAHVGRRYLGSIGKIDNGVVSVHSLWADERMYYPLEVAPYTPAHWFEIGRQDADFRTKPENALELVENAIQNQLPFRTLVADSAYGNQFGFVEGLERLELGYVLALKPSHSSWHKIGKDGSVAELVQRYPWNPEAPGTWKQITSRSWWL